jgi:hypothetical protein
MGMNMIASRVPNFVVPGDTGRAKIKLLKRYFVLSRDWLHKHNTIMYLPAELMERPAGGKATTMPKVVVP